MLTAIEQLHSTFNIVKLQDVHEQDIQDIQN